MTLTVPGLVVGVADGSAQVGSLWMVVPVVAVIAGAFALSASVARGHTRGARELARRPGWTYYERDDSVLASFDGWPFTSGSDPVATDVLRGSHRGRPAVAFVYTFTGRPPGNVVGLAQDWTPSARQRSEERHGIFHGLERVLGGTDNGSLQRGRRRVVVVAMEMPEALPGFLVRIQLPTDMLVAGLQDDDVLLGDPHFDDAYLVRAEHPQLAWDLLPPANRQRLLAHSPFAGGPHGGRRAVSTLHDSPANGFTMWTAGRQLLVAVNARLDRSGHDAVLDLMADFLDGVPGWVWRVAAGGLPPPPPPPPPPAAGPAPVG